MADRPTFTVPLPFRCFHQVEGRTWRVCGAPAEYEQQTADPSRPRYFCRKHARSTDTPIADAAVVRRVSLQLEVVFAGTSWLPGSAHAEALQQVERALADSGGVISLTAVSSVVGTAPRQAPAGGARGSVGGGH